MADEPESDLNRYVGFGAAAVVLAFFFSPILDRLPPISLFSSGAAFACSLVSFYRVWGGGRILGWFSIIFGVMAVLAAVAIFQHAISRLEREDAANSVRCIAVQNDMLSAHPRIANAPDVFQALGCSPGGTDPHIFVPPSDRERAAGHALPYGGYPPPR